MSKPKLIRVTTVPISLEKLLGKQLSFMDQHFDLTAVSADATALVDVGKKLGVKTYPVEMTRRITPIQDLKVLWKMYRFLKSERPDIIHSHTPKAGLVSMLAAKLVGVPNRLHTVAGLPLMEAQGLKRKILMLVEQLTYAAATHVYPNSKGLSDFILENKLTTSSKLKVIANGSSNGIDTTYFDKDNLDQNDLFVLKKSLKIEDDDEVFIFVGRLVGDKGLNELIEAFDEIGKNNTKSKLILVGTFEDQLDPLQTSTLEKIKSNSNIINVGWQTDVRPYLAIADILTFPSYREGFPNVVMQAGAMGLASIVSNINGCNEIIIENKNGLIIPVKNKKALEEAMQKLLNDQVLFNSLKTNARPMIVDRYQQQVVWDALLTEYKSLLGARS
ncbi:Glycosyltransferase involved in cell wall bisynthesis [Soonwooa buanensis]|uniref:Glycosyltransferase involved in cell wall bisynthesis n=1 Tax=Soonwooa buanensis TaxID=619805 RepID=A0A1T5GRP3_9FLAO|nr:glycosyltransferase family 4 protein [Soonwooa buanensis]SKC11066.1 Glycosyltransferase involved in cell wall bisynthesis [Soonwooa buanensis]